MIIYSAFRNRGYGGEGLDLLCAAARESGIDVLYDDIAADNPAISIFLRMFFALLLLPPLWRSRALPV